MKCSTTGRRWALLWLMIASLTCAVPAVARAPKKNDCKKIRDAVWAGHTLDQLTAEFDTDAKHVMQCTQAQGKSRKPPKDQTKSSAKAKSSAGGTHGSTSTHHKGP